jgi:hypothetical protein
MTDDTKSLSKQLRRYAEGAALDTYAILFKEAADALDAKDELIKRQSAEIGRLVAVTLHCGAQEAEVERLNRLLISEGANRYWESRWRADAEIALRRRLHDEWVDHLEQNLPHIRTPARVAALMPHAG